MESPSVGFFKATLVNVCPWMVSIAMSIIPNHKPMTIILVYLSDTIVTVCAPGSTITVDHGRSVGRNYNHDINENLYQKKIKLVEIVYISIVIAQIS